MSEQAGDILGREFWCAKCQRFTPWVVIDPASENNFAECTACGHR